MTRTGAVSIRLTASVGLAAYSTWIFDKKQRSFCASSSTDNVDASPVPYEWNKNWDNKHDLYNAKKKVGTHYIVLVRHGQYEERQELDKDRKLTGLCMIETLYIHIAIVNTFVDNKNLIIISLVDTQISDDSKQLGQENA